MRNSIGRVDKGSIYKDRGRNIWWIKYYLRGQMKRESSRSRNPDVATRLLKIREGEMAKQNAILPDIRPIKFAELKETIHMDYQLKNRKTWRDTEARLRIHILPFFNNRLAGSITEQDIEKFASKRLKEGASHGELNRELYVISHMFRLAIKRKILLAMPDVGQFVAQEDNIRTGFFEEKDFRKLLKFLPIQVQPVARFAYITGWRIPSMVLPLQLECQL